MSRSVRERVSPPSEWIQTRRDLTKGTRHAYVLALERARRRFLEQFDFDLSLSVNGVSARHLWDFIEWMDDMSFSVDYRRQSWGVLCAWLGFNGCRAIHEVHPRWPDQERSVDWLEPDQLLACWKAATALGPDHRIILTLELYSLLRCIEVKRMLVEDAKLPHDKILIRGKGRGGPKIKPIARSPHVTEELGLYFEHRQALIERHGGGKASFVPEHEKRLILIHYAGRLRSPATSTLDNRVNEIHQRAGTGSGGHHVFRRSGARYLWATGIPIEVIKELLRHESISQTHQYLGIKLDDQSNAVVEFSPDMMAQTSAANRG